VWGVGVGEGREGGMVRHEGERGDAGVGGGWVAAMKGPMCAMEGIC
jgi:hypothetical protein